MTFHVDGIDERLVADDVHPYRETILQRSRNTMLPTDRITVHDMFEEIGHLRTLSYHLGPRGNALAYRDLKRRLTKYEVKRYKTTWSDMVERDVVRDERHGPTEMRFNRIPESTCE